jgi:hypothetical protein
MSPSAQLPRLVLCALLVVCGLLHLQEVSGSVPTDLSHPGWNHDKLVEQGEKTGLGVHDYMKKLEENCFEKKIKGACDAYAYSMKDYFDLHKDAAVQLRESCENGNEASRAPNKAACEAFEHVKKMYFHLHDDV